MSPASVYPARGVFYFDVVSPFSYLAFARLQQQKIPIELEFKPVLFAAILNHFGQKGPAEIPEKRIFTYQQCTWLAAQYDIAFFMPSAHPFNPVRYLRLILALGSTRTAINEVFKLLFTSGQDPEDDATFLALVRHLEVHDAQRLIQTEQVKAQLRSNTDEAIAAGVFGVPTVLHDGRMFWGADALPMLNSYLKRDGAFDTPAMQAAISVRVGATRKA